MKSSIEWSKAHDIAVKVTGLDPRKMKYPDPNDWSLLQSSKWFSALNAAKIALNFVGENNVEPTS